MRAQIKSPLAHISSNLSVPSFDQVEVTTVFWCLGNPAFIDWEALSFVVDLLESYIALPVFLSTLTDLNLSHHLQLVWIETLRVWLSSQVGEFFTIQAFVAWRMRNPLFVVRSSSKIVFVIMSASLRKKSFEVDRDYKPVCLTFWNSVDLEKEPLVSRVSHDICYKDWSFGNLHFSPCFSTVPTERNLSYCLVVSCSND
jgi:hypothetical protein